MAPSRTALAFTLLALVGIVQFGVIAKLTASQRDDAHLIDISGIARMHSQRIAYFSARANDGHPEVAWRSQVEASIGAIRAGQIEAHRFPSLDAVLDPTEQSALDIDLDLERYFGAARAVEAHPADGGAFGLIARLRPTVLAELEHVVALRTAGIARQNRVLFGILFVGGILGVVTLVCTYGFLASAERRLRWLLDSVTVQREEMLSLFDANPDAIAVYDDAGLLVRTNRARCELIGRRPSEMLGKPLSEFVDPAWLATARELFERARQGVSFVGEFQLRSAAGDPMARSPAS